MPSRHHEICVLERVRASLIISQRRYHSALSYLRVLQGSPHLGPCPTRTMAHLLRRALELHGGGEHLRLYP